MVLNHVVIIVLLGWDVRSSSLVSVVRRVSGLKRRPPWGIGMDGILRVGISHSIMAIGMWSIGRALKILVGGGGGGWEHTMGQNVGRWQEGHSCVDGSGNAWGLWEAAGLSGMCVQNAQPGDIVDISPNHRWCKNFCSSQEVWGRH